MYTLMLDETIRPGKNDIKISIVLFTDEIKALNVGEE